MTCKKSKGKGLPQQAEVAQGVPGRFKPRIFLTFGTTRVGRSSAIRTGRLHPRRNPWYSLSEAESTPGNMVLSGEPRKKSPVTTPGINPGTIRLVAQCFNHYATPSPNMTHTFIKCNSKYSAFPDKCLLATAGIERPRRRYYEVWYWWCVALKICLIPQVKRCWFTCIVKCDKKSCLHSLRQNTQL